MNNTAAVIHPALPHGDVFSTSRSTYSVSCIVSVTRSKTVSCTW